jgi:acetate CoA/acetoacetate CoA-transferase alpha subunit
MGSFIERIRCGGMGLGGVLTKTGLGTVVEEGKQMVEVNGERYLLETALRADISITRARRADPIGNLAFRGSSGRASHPIMATCGKLSIVECDHFCDLGEITPDQVEVPGMFIDMILV